MVASLFEHILIPVVSLEDTEATLRTAHPYIESVGGEVTVGDDDDGHSPKERGHAIIEDLAERASIDGSRYDSHVEVADDIEGTILDVASAYDTICVGATRSGAVSQAVFGSLPETIGEQADGTVVMARGPEESAMSVREAVVRRLES